MNDLNIFIPFLFLTLFDFAIFMLLTGSSSPSAKFPSKAKDIVEVGAEAFTYWPESLTRKEDVGGFRM